MALNGTRSIRLALRRLSQRVSTKKSEFTRLARRWGLASTDVVYEELQSGRLEKR